MKIEKGGWAFPDADEFMVGHLSHDAARAKWTYQLSHLDAAMRYVQHRRCALDGGAHVGTWATELSPLFERVIAVEPSPDTFEALQYNLTDRGCLNVEAKNVALGSAPGLIEMTLRPEQAEKKNTGARYVMPGGEIPVITIDSLALEHLDFLKLDVEGSEYAALKGAGETLKRCRPVVLYEDKKLWTKHYGIAPEAVANLLTKRGYQQVARVSMDAIWVPR